MKNKLLTFIILLVFAVSYSQTQKFSPQNVDEVEQLIKQYITKNSNSISLNDIEIETEKDHPVSDEELKQLKINQVKIKLREQFFNENISLKSLYDNQVDLTRSAGTCVNPGFEQGVQGFNFNTHAYNNSFDNFNGCGTNVNTNIPVAVGALNSNALVSPVSPGNDPVLAPFDVQLPRVLNGQRAIRLNNDAGNNNNRQIVTMSRNYTITEDQLVFNFAAVMEDNGHTPQSQPFFQVRLYDQNNNWVNQNNSNCIVTTVTDCIFINSNRPNTNDQLLYIPWTCFTLDTSQLIGQQVRVEWSIGDCAWDEHFGYVYIDDVCDTICQSPAFGNIDLLPIDGACPEFPLTICANYTTPVSNNGGNSTLQNSNIYVNGGAGPINLNLTPTVTANQICFTINENDLPSTNSTDTYEISVDAIFQLNCGTVPQTITLIDNSTNAGEDISFPNDCCEEVLCPDVSIEKSVIGSIISGATYEPGDTITYAITVANNEPETTCPFTFDVADIIDTTILDETTFNSNSFGVLYNSSTDTVSINNISLLSGESQTYYFSFEILENTLAESIENCVIANTGCISGPIKSCVTTQIVQPASIWPRTYGNTNFVNTGRYSEDVATDDDGNVYTLGNIALGDITNEDSGFTSSEKGYIMKHDFFGNLIWITPISIKYHGLKDGGLIKYYNDKLHVFTNKGYYLGYTADGVYISAYETGLQKPAISLNTYNGNFVIAGTYYSNFNNGDYNITATGNRPTGAVIKFGATGFSGDYEYITHQTFTHNGNTGESAITIKDIVYAEDTNRIFLTGSFSGNRFFPNGQTFNYPYGKAIVITLKDDNTFLNMTNSAYLTNKYFELIEYRNSDDKIYVNAQNRLFEIPFSALVGFGNDIFIDNVFQYNSNPVDMVINQETGDLFSTGYNGKNGYGEVSKIVSQGRIWNKRIYEIAPKAIVVSEFNHYFITGNYTGNTELNPNSIDLNPIYDYGSKDNIFIARFKDYGDNGQFRNKVNVKDLFERKLNKFKIVPNPATDYFKIHSVNEIDLINSVTIRDIGGLVQKSIDGNLKNYLTVNDFNLKTGLYLIEIIYNDNQREVVNVIVK